MAAFSLFWTAIAIRLAQAPFGLGQRGIALFAFVGAGGAAATPLVGRIGDRGFTRPATIASISPSSPPSGSRLGQIHVGVTGDQTLGRRAINLLQPEARGGINGLFVGMFFLGGAVGAALEGIVWASGGWPPALVREQDQHEQHSAGEGRDGEEVH